MASIPKQARAQVEGPQVKYICIKGLKVRPEVKQLYDYIMYRTFNERKALSGNLRFRSSKTSVAQRPNELLDT
jgi:hypothetical protein